MKFEKISKIFYIMPGQNQWLSHVADYRKANPTVSYKDSLKLAKATYKQPVAPPPSAPVVEVPVKKVKAKKVTQM